MTNNKRGPSKSCISFEEYDNWIVESLSTNRSIAVFIIEPNGRRHRIAIIHESIKPIVFFPQHQEKNLPETLKQWVSNFIENSRQLQKVNYIMSI